MWPSFTSLLELPGPSGGVPELLAPNSRVWHLGRECFSLVESLLLVIFSTSPSWMSASCDMPELMAPFWEGSIYRWKNCIWKLLCMGPTITVLIVRSIISSQEPGNKSNHLQGPVRQKALIRQGAASAPKGPLLTLLSPPQCLAPFGTIPHTSASVDQNPVHHPRTLPPVLRTSRVGIWTG